LTVIGWRDVVGFDEEEGRESIPWKVVEVSKRVFEVKIHGLETSLFCEVGLG